LQTGRFLNNEQGEAIMAESETFIQEFETLLKRIPADISFRALQYDYRQVAFLMGMKVLERYPEILTGSPPAEYSDAPAPIHEGKPVPRPIVRTGPSLNPHPHDICTFSCTILSY
jgi:hypothetical protein